MEYADMSPGPKFFVSVTRLGVMLSILFLTLRLAALTQAYDARAMNEIHGQQITRNIAEIENLDHRVASIEGAHFPEQLAGIAKTVELDHNILIAVGVGVLGMLLETASRFLTTGRKRETT